MCDITNRRHIPAIKKQNNTELIGVIGDNEKNIEATCLRYGIKNSFVLDRNKDYIEQLQMCAWFVNDVDAVVIGTPPHEHYLIVKATLACGKHTLIEKPMMMNVNECNDVNRLSEEKGLILNVMHSFQFASGILSMENRFKSGEFGDLKSIVEIQLTNRDRKLPKWYNELPLGLYYDEAAHFFYSALRFGNGKLDIKNAHVQKNINENTPRFLEVQAVAGDIPVQMTMNFNSPICEWGLLLLCDKKIAIYDYFKDILIVIDNDNNHDAKDVLKTSFQFFAGFWSGFVKNGFKMISNNLLYGHDVVISKFVKAIETGKSDEKIDKKIGKEVVEAMNRVVELADGEI